MPLDLRKYVHLFFDGADRHMREIDDSMSAVSMILELGKQWDAMFRALHSIKSSAAMTELHPIPEFAQAFENLVSAIRRQPTPFLWTETLDVMNRARETLRALVEWKRENPAGDEPPADLARRLESTIRLLVLHTESVRLAGRDGGGPPLRVFLDEETRLHVLGRKRAGERVYEILVRLNAEPGVAAARARSIAGRLNQLGVVLKTEPDLFGGEEIANGRIAVLASSLEPEGEIREALRLGGAETATVRDVTNLEQFQWDSARKAADDKDEAEESGPVVTSFERREDRMAGVTFHAPVAELDNLIAALWDAQAERRAERAEAPELEMAIGMRRAPLHGPFRGFQRLAADLSRERGAPIEFVFEGGDVRADQVMVRELGEACACLIQLLAASIPEPARDGRRAAGPVSGRIELSASGAGGMLRIGLRCAEVQISYPPDDDRHALDPNADALMRLAEMDPAGMFAVRTVESALAAVRGRLWTAPLGERGVEIGLFAPLSPFLRMVFPVVHGGGRWLVPAECVEDRLPAGHGLEARLGGSGARLLFAGRPVPLITPAGAAPGTDANRPVLFIRHVFGGIACMVDEAGDTAEAFIRPFANGAREGGQSGPLGLTRDGAAAPLLDTAALIARAPGG